MLVSLEADAGKAARFARLPAGRVPALDHDGLVVWDGLAICEYLAERHPGLGRPTPRRAPWPAPAAAEMHGGLPPASPPDLCVRKHLHQPVGLS